MIRRGRGTGNLPGILAGVGGKVQVQQFFRVRRRRFWATDEEGVCHCVKAQGSGNLLTMITELRAQFTNLSVS